MDPDATPQPDASASPEQQALQQALGALMGSVARLGVAKGLPYAAVEDMLRLAFVQAAAQAHPGLPEHRKVSRISTTTGINRREVTRLVQMSQARAPAPAARSLPSEVFARWRTQPPYVDAQGESVPLPRQGPEPSFETLAQAVTRDVHPRSLLDELVRLGQARWDEATDTVHLIGRTFAATGDMARQLGFLGDNVGDHLRAAVENVLSERAHVHFEQAVFADGLSLESIESIRPAVFAQWQAMLRVFVPALEQRAAVDAQQQPPPQGRLRLGLYTYHEGASPPAPAPTDPAPRTKRRT